MLKVCYQICHREEWLASGVNNRIIDLNVEPVSGVLAYERMRGRTAKRLQTGGKPLNKSEMGWYRKYEATEGWLVYGVDVTNNFVRTDWCRYKPTVGQLIDPKKGKPIKYVSPKDEGSHPIFLKVDRETWKEIANNNNLIVDFDRYIDFWEWAEHTPSLPVVIVEGEKKAGSLLSAGICAISLPGMTMGRPENPLTGKPELWEELAIYDTLGRDVRIVFDRESDPKKAKTVNNSAIKLGYCFKSAKVSIGYLPGPQKGIDDFLVSGGNFGDIKFKTLAQIKADKSWAMTYQPDVILNEQYLPDLQLPKTGVNIIKSPKGTGKTESLKADIADSIGRGQKTLIISPRIVLGKELCSTVGIPWISEVANYYQDTESGKAWKDGRFLGFGICMDSLHPHGKARIIPSEWKGARLIFDEFEQTAWHLLSSGTCYENRIKILETLKELVETVVLTDGVINILDADLSDLSINFLRSLAGSNVKPYIVRNDWKPVNPWQVKIFSPQEGSGKAKDNPSEMLNESVKLVNNGGKICVHTDTQQVKSLWGSTNLESFYKRKCPNARILRVDSSTLADPNHAAFGITGHINESVKDYDIVICSPSIVSGVSIDIKEHFSAVFGIFQGSIPINDCLQSLARVRESVTRFIWVAKKAAVKIGDGGLSPKEIISSKDKELSQNIRLLQIADFNVEENTERSSLETWAKMACRLNAAAINFRESLADRLAEEGHIISFFSEINKEIMDCMKIIKQENINSEAVEVVNAVDLSELQYEELQKKHSKTRGEQLAERKHTLKKKYGVKQLSETLKKLDDTRGWHPRLRLHYYLTHKRDYLNLRDIQHIERHQERGGGKVCSQDLRLLSVRVGILKKLGILNFLDGRQISKHDSEVKAVAALCFQGRADLRAKFGITVTADIAENKPVWVIQSLLKQIGLKLTKQKQQRRACTDDQESDREWLYRFEGESFTKLEPLGLRQAIFEEWEQRDIDALAKRQANQVLDWAG